MCGMVVPGDRFMEGMPQLLNLAHPWRIHWLKSTMNFRIFCQPSLRFFALVDDVVIQDQRGCSLNAPISPLLVFEQDKNKSVSLLSLAT